MKKSKLFPHNIKKIAILELAGAADHVKLQHMAALIQSMGVEVQLPVNAEASSVSYVAGSIESRLKSLYTAWQNPEIEAILCARGGYGTMQLLPHIDWSVLYSRPVPLLGFSDITALHLAMIANNCGTPVTSPMAIHMDKLVHCPFTADWFYWALSGVGHRKKLPLKAAGYEIITLKHLPVSAPMFMVNLTMLCALCGTPFLPDMTGRILIVEDVNESAYAIDRKLSQLRLAGVLEQLAGLVFGAFTGCDNEGDFQGCIRSFVHDVKGPVLAGFPFGHDFPMVSVPYGACLKLSKDGTIVLENQC